MSLNTRIIKNIKQQIRKVVERDDCFGNEFSWDHNDEFKQLTLEYLNKQTYKDSVESAKKLIKSVLSKHDKDKDVGPITELLEYFEKEGLYSFAKQRVHYMHQLNVFLLGLYLYQKAPIIRSSIDKEIASTTTDLLLCQHGQKLNWRYSGGTSYGEFLYRWRLASLSHDIGYLISLNKKGNKDIIKMINHVLSIYNTKIYMIEDIWMFKNINLLNQLDNAIMDVSIEKYINYQGEHPYKGEVYYDHGIISALLLLRLMNEAYDKHQNSECTMHKDILWHPSFLTGSILQAAIPIALHNLDKDKAALRQCTNNFKIFNLNSRPLSWLLKISDTLQEWDKPLAKKVKDSDPLPCTNYRILVCHNTIIARDFPAETKKDANDIIHRYIHPQNAVCIE